MKAGVMERGSAAEAKTVGMVQMFWRDVWAVVDKGGAGVVVENKVQIGMRDVGVMGRVSSGEDMREGVAVGKGAIIHRVVNR